MVLLVKRKVAVVEVVVEVEVVIEAVRDKAVEVAAVRGGAVDDLLAATEGAGSASI